MGLTPRLPLRALRATLGQLAPHPWISATFCSFSQLDAPLSSATLAKLRNAAMHDSAAFCSCSSVLHAFAAVCSFVQLCCSILQHVAVQHVLLEVFFPMLQCCVGLVFASFPGAARAQGVLEELATTTQSQRTTCLECRAEQAIGQSQAQGGICLQ